MTDEFPSERTSSVESVALSWRHDCSSNVICGAIVDQVISIIFGTPLNEFCITFQEDGEEGFI